VHLLKVIMPLLPLIQLRHNLLATLDRYISAKSNKILRILNLVVKHMKN